MQHKYAHSTVIMAIILTLVLQQALLKFRLPGEVCSVQLLEVTGRGRIERVDFASILLPGVDVVNQLVQVLVPQVGILILEV